MDRDHLTRLIDDPARVQRDDIADLKAMAERYPWFSGAHLLLAVGGHREGDVLFDEQLRASAAHLPSRAVLFDRLHTPMPMAPAPTFPARPEPISAPEIQQEVQAHLPVVQEVPGPLSAKPSAIPVEPATLPTAEPVIPVVEEITVEAIAPVPAERTLPEVEEPKAEAAPPASPVASLPEHIPTPWKERLLRGDRDEEELDRQMRDSAVAISYELLLEREGLLETAPVEPRVAAIPEPVQEIPRPTTAAPPPPIALRSFSDWLSAGTTDAPPSATITPKEAAQMDKSAPASQRPPAARPVVDPEIIRAVHQLPPIEPKHAPETPETKALIDRFLQQNSQVPQAPKKAEFYNPQTAAKRSLEEHADLVTETLARIYEKQGNIAKAIAAYERLAVKHPEKNAHFRALAKALSGR